MPCVFSYNAHLCILLIGTGLQGAHLILHLRSANKSPNISTSFMHVSDLHFRTGTHISEPPRPPVFSGREIIADEPVGPGPEGI